MNNIEKAYCKLIDKAMFKLGHGAASTYSYFVPSDKFEKRMQMLQRYRKLWGIK